MTTVWADFPQAEIIGGGLAAKVYLPDTRNGYYRGTRFDWSGIVSSLKFAGHEFFGEWFDKHDPLTHDAITGPVDVFDPDGIALGYREAKAGGHFLRIGVGVLEKPDESPFRSTYTYKVVDTGRWAIKAQPDRIQFGQDVSDPIGYAYRYRKQIALRLDRPEMVVSYSLTNTGRRLIDTAFFNHNFFVIDRQISGPGMFAKFAFQVKPVGEIPDQIEVRHDEISFRRSLIGQERVYVPIEGYGPSARDYDIRVENRKSGCGVRITSDQPLEKLIFWSRPRVVGPEPYIRLRVEPGKTAAWETRYRFYTL